MEYYCIPETDEDIARYSILHDNDRLFMSKYLTYLPTKEQLKTEIDRQKGIFSCNIQLDKRAKEK